MHSHRQYKIKNHIQNSRARQKIERCFRIAKGTQNAVGNIIYELRNQTKKTDLGIQKRIPHRFSRTGEPQQVTFAQQFSHQRQKNACSRCNRHRCSNGLAQFVVLPRAKEPRDSGRDADAKTDKEIDMYRQHQPGNTHRRQTESAAKPSYHGTVRNIIKLQQKLHKEQRRGICQQFPVNGTYVHAHLTRDRFFRRPG